MKKTISVFLVIILLFNISLAFAEEVDFSKYSDDELRSFITSARIELIKRLGKSVENTLIYDGNGIKIYLTGNYNDINMWGQIELECVVVNETGKEIAMWDDDAYVNGWSAYTRKYIVNNLKTGKKEKGTIYINAKKANLSSFEDIEDIVLYLKVVDTDKNELFIANDINIQF